MIRNFQGGIVVYMCILVYFLGSILEFLCLCMHIQRKPFVLSEYETLTFKLLKCWF